MSLLESLANIITDAKKEENKFKKKMEKSLFDIKQFIVSEEGKIALEFLSTVKKKILIARIGHTYYYLNGWGHVFRNNDLIGEYSSEKLESILKDMDYNYRFFSRKVCMFVGVSRIRWELKKIVLSHRLRRMVGVRVGGY